MRVAHIGRWIVARIVYDQDGGSRWKPQGLAVFSDDGRYRYADKDIDESGARLSDGPTVTTEDPSMGTLSVWHYHSERDQLERELSDEETGYRGSASLVFERADDDAFRAPLAALSHGVCARAVNRPTMKPIAAHRAWSPIGATLHGSFATAS